ncbi:hypothetical protein ASG25_13330 [Rhizobium sp. Leaf384]|uniref:hypothetical protein n=1 Tax=unclassified Rhizobium TaxID=2613769 RepID=UPI000713120C|nr:MULTISPECIES: hypothetical protein [unclassified Rhizobium]KQS78072.1 hypothetical protein ASG58_06580 [Rhizobium sp. Leaf383]KQS79491.1 hypothetical protein ASG25_13330 [Rhizobium sp. Leaf384]
MYNIDSMYECMTEGVVKALRAKTAERWAVCASIWLARQQIFNAQDFWYAVAGKMLSELPAVEVATIEGQFSKAEDTLFSTVGDWPTLPEGLAARIGAWTPAPADIDLDALRADAVLKVDRAAEAYRMQFITPGYGQLMAYQQKLEEARDKLANPSIANDKIPHIIAEAAADDMTPLEKAEQVVAAFSAFQQVSANVEAKRTAAKKAIAEATTAEAITAASNISWADE